jgi:hypothetical protein
MGIKNIHLFLICASAGLGFWAFTHHEIAISIIALLMLIGLVGYAITFIKKNKTSIKAS